MKWFQQTNLIHVMWFGLLFQVDDSQEKTELEQTRMQLVQSQAEVVRLAQIRDDVENEVRELTASLFQVISQQHNFSRISICFTSLCRAWKIKIPVFFLFSCKCYPTYANVS